MTARKTAQRVPNGGKYQTLVNNLSVGVYRNTPGPSGHFLEANPAMVLMFDASSKEELLKHNVSDLYQDPKKRRLFVKKLQEKGFVKDEILHLVTLKGRKMIASVNAVMKKAKNGTVYFDGVIEDITAYTQMMAMLKKTQDNLEIRVTERTDELNGRVRELEGARRAMTNILEDLNEEKSRKEKLANDLFKFKLALDNVSDHVTITDSEGITVYVNNAVERITGYSPEELIGTKAGAFWKLPMPLAYYQNLWRTIKTYKKTFTSEIQNRRRDGQVYTATISISPVLDSAGNILFFVGLERDITREKEIDKAKTEFVSLASHQLRTPLTSISWYAEMILNGDAGAITPDQKKYVDEIYADNRRMIVLVNTLLDVSRLELGTFQSEPKPTDILAMARSVIEDLQSKITKKNLTIISTLDAAVPLLSIDPNQLRMVLQNILSNATTYTPPGGTVEIAIAESDAKHVRIKISDTGYGIPKHQHDKIFTKFFRADNVRGKDTEGTGLGLYIVKSIVENFGGKIWFESEENVGSTFFVELPMYGTIKKENTYA